MAHPEFSTAKACVFDAYGTLFDVHSAVGRGGKALGDKAAAVSELWRLKQLEYTWLRAITGAHVDFWQVTGDALDYALETHGVSDAALRDRLMELYLTLDAYPEVPDTLSTLRDAGYQTAILSNGAPKMLQSAVDSAGLSDRLDQVLSVEEVGIFKPHDSIYQLAVDRLGVAAGEICFLSSNGWDAFSAARFGFKVAWINRFEKAEERIPEKPQAAISTLDELPPLLGV